MWTQYAELPFFNKDIPGNVRLKNGYNNIHLIIDVAYKTEMTNR